jgi:hypothetical protein
MESCLAELQNYVVDRAEEGEQVSQKVQGNLQEQMEQLLEGEMEKLLVRE